MKPSDHRIMIVDDEAGSENAITPYIQACGYRVVEVKWASSVSKRVLKEMPSLILLDLTSSQTGLKACRELKNDPATRPYTVIIAAKLEHPSDKLVALELGADDYVSKPINLHELSLRIERSLERAHDKFAWP